MRRRHKTEHQYTEKNTQLNISPSQFTLNSRVLHDQEISITLGGLSRKKPLTATLSTDPMNIVSTNLPFPFSHSAPTFPLIPLAIV